MTTYYMTSHRDSETGYWEPCKSTTLAGAKREASREYDAGYIDAVLMVCTGDGDTAEREILASKTGGYWTNLRLQGRPKELSGGKRVNVYLDSASLERAEKLGAGNVSAGIREALGSK